MTNEIKITSVSEDTETGWTRYIGFEYDGLEYTGWLSWDSDGLEFNGVYGDFEELFNKMGDYLDNDLLDSLSYDLQQGISPK